jgi:hypothetical protein
VMFSLSEQEMLNIKIFSRKAKSSYKFKSISKQNNNSCQTCFQHKYNNRILTSILNIYPNLQLILIQSFSMHINNKNTYV